MLVLLPPSEGKTAPARGAPVDLAALGAPGLTEHRSVVLDALATTSARPDAARVLGVGAGLADEVERNTRLRVASAARAASVYTGVLFAAAGLDRLPDGAARDRAHRSVRIVSALWGVLAPGDRIPAYRLSMAVDLPGVGPLAASWRPHLAAELDRRAGELVVDCRSTAYAAAWRPPTGARGWVAVSVLRELGGRRTVVSHNAKHARGELTRHLLVRSGRPPTTPEGLLAAARELVGGPLVDAELEPAPPGSHGARGPRTLTLVVA
ncbi:YaaA family protein [Cellulomonas fimi]|uniref:Peroxide stress protein YaaA n=1 Tax=Cellulomonas fimi TaxID=1708 RepID=A0A7Y0QGE6_CELFI|nr:peroxide stress protein YaaA [Cellulomonas fimi]NMR19155.1 peroxide stress protein YaaA [Cellulomonas fimi]